MLLRAFVCARNVRDGNDDGQVVEEEKFDVSGWAKSREKKIMGERGYFIYSKNCGIAKDFMDICKLEEFLFVVLEIWRCLFEVEERKNY